MSIRSKVCMLAMTACLLTACEVSEGQANKVDALTFEVKQLKREGGLHCETQASDSQESFCANVQFSYPWFKGVEGSLIVKQLNQHVQLAISADEEGKTTAEQAADDFIKEYKSEPVLNDWDLERRVEVVYQSERLITFRSSEFAFTGGAHPSSNLSYTVLDLQTGKEIKLNDLLVSDYDGKLNVVGERAFRLARNIAADISLEEEGFWFTNNVFLLNTNFGVTEKGLVFFFNNYEVAPYAMGTTEVLIPFEDIAPLIRPDGLLAAMVQG